LHRLRLDVRDPANVKGLPHSERIGWGPLLRTLQPSEVPASVTD